MPKKIDTNTEATVEPTPNTEATEPTENANMSQSDAPEATVEPTPAAEKKQFFVVRAINWVYDQIVGFFKTTVKYTVVTAMILVALFTGAGMLAEYAPQTMSKITNFLGIEMKTVMYSPILSGVVFDEVSGVTIIRQSVATEEEIQLGNLAAVAAAKKGYDCIVVGGMLNFAMQQVGHNSNGLSWFNAIGGNEVGIADLLKVLEGRYDKVAILMDNVYTMPVISPTVAHVSMGRLDLITGKVALSGVWGEAKPKFIAASKNLDIVMKGGELSVEFADVDYDGDINGNSKTGMFGSIARWWNE